MGLRAGAQQRQEREVSHNTARARSEPHGRNEREWAELFISPRERERQRERQAH